VAQEGQARRLPNNGERIGVKMPKCRGDDVQVQLLKVVIARLDRAIQYAAAHRLKHCRLWILDHPLSRVMTSEWRGSSLAN
jgi:hypothetical protein